MKKITWLLTAFLVLAFSGVTWADVGAEEPSLGFPRKNNFGMVGKPLHEYKQIHMRGFTASGVAYILPTSDGTGGYQLTTDSSGNLTWAAAGGTSITFDAVGDPAATNTTFVFDDNELTQWTFADTDADMFRIQGIGAFDDVTVFRVEQITGDPTDGTVLEVVAADTNVDPFVVSASSKTNAFVVGQNTGVVTIAGVAEATSALIITAGDILVSAGDLHLDAGDALFDEDVTVGGWLNLTGDLVGGTGLINYTYFDVDAAGAITATALDAGSGDITTTGTISATTIQQDNITANTINTALGLDGTAGAAGGVDIGTNGGTGPINLGHTSYSTEVILGAGVNLDLVGGDLTIVDTATSDLVQFTNNTLTANDLVQMSATGTRLSGAVIKITDGATTANTITITANTQTSGHGVSYTNTGGTTLTGAAFYANITDGAYSGYYFGGYNGSGYDFTVARYGATVIAGNAIDTPALTLTAGDVLLTAGHILLTTGHIGIGNITLEAWDESGPDLSALQVGGAGFFAAATVQAASDSSYLGHNAYFDNTHSAWEAMSTNADDEAVMLQMTDGTWIFNVEDTALGDDATITWIPSLIIAKTGNVGVGTGTAANIAQEFHVEQDNAATAAAVVLVRLSVTSEGSPAAGLGPSIEFEVETASGGPGNQEIIGAMDVIATDVSGASEEGAFIFKTMKAGSAATEDVRIEALSIGIGVAATPDEMLHIKSATSAKPVVKLENTNTDANSAILEFNKNSANAADDDVVALIRFYGDDSTDAETLYGYIEVLSSDITDGGPEAGQVDIYAMVSGTNRSLVSVGGEDTNAGDPAEVVINEDSIDADFRVETDSYDKALFVDGATGLVSGDLYNDQMTRIMVGSIYDIMTDPLLVLAWLTPATTEQDLTVEDHDATYVNMETTDQTAEGFVWSLELGGTDEYLTVVDHADFTFASAGDDTDVSFGFWIEIYSDANVKTIMAKYDDTNSQLEWEIFVDADEKVNLRFYDESIGVTAYEGRISDALVSDGWHFIALTYNDSQQDETASDTMIIYVDGVLVASSASDGVGAYSFKEDLGQQVWIGAQGEADAYGDGWVGEIGLVYIDQATWTAAVIYKMWMIGRGYYNL